MVRCIKDFIIDGKIIVKNGTKYFIEDQDRYYVYVKNVDYGFSYIEMNEYFEEIKQIIDLVKDKDHIGVCLDTCHVWDGGYDIQNQLDSVLELFDNIIGLERLKAIHLNDSLNPCNSHKDRHACIGKGQIGLEALVKVINHPKLFKLPFYLETPNELPGYAAEIKLLREKYICARILASSALIGQLG